MGSTPHRAAVAAPSRPTSSRRCVSAARSAGGAAAPAPPTSPCSTRLPDEALPIEELAMDPAELGLPPAAHTHPEDDPEAIRLDAPGRPSTGRRAPSPSGRSQDTEPVEGGAARTSSPCPTSGTTTMTTEPMTGRRRPLPAPTTRSPTTSRHPTTAVITGPRRRHRRSAGRRAGRPVRRRRGAGRRCEDPCGRPDAAPEQPAKPAARKSGRPGVPSWDDIMFGRKGD